MKITIPMKHLDGRIEFIDVQAYMPFEMFGFTFAVHLPLKQNGDQCTAEMGQWNVAEVSTGQKVSDGRTKKEAIENAKTRLQVNGEIVLKKAVAKGLRRRKENRKAEGIAYGGRNGKK